jgi:hypothetical protein
MSLTVRSGSEVLGNESCNGGACVTMKGCSLLMAPR